MEVLAPLLEQFGLPLAAVLALAVAVKVLYERNKELTDTVIRLSTEGARAQEASTAAINRFVDLQNARRQD